MATSFNVNFQPRPRFFYQPQFQSRPRAPMMYRAPGYQPRPRFSNPPPQGGQGQMQTGDGLDGKRMRKSLHRKTVDYNSSVIKYLENRVWQRDSRDMHALQPDPVYVAELEPPAAYENNVMNCVPTKFVRQSTNKMRCPIFCLAWTPEGRRLVTGASSGEFTLWNGLTFNFETILQAHDTAIRAMVWSHADQWMVTGDHGGYLKYWQSNMNNVKMFPAHPEAIRGLSFCPSDSKFASCSDDGTVRLWDFARCQEEKVLRGHGADVKCVDWHPQKSLLASGSKDSQQPIKLWDPKSGQGLATIHAHKNTVMQLKWSPNGSWLLTASRDHLIKLFDIRNLKEELQTFKGHKKEASAIAWHPLYEGMFASGGAEGSIMYWVVGTDKEVGSIEEAHEHVIWTLDWHPMGHILVSGSNDHSTKFWTRNRPGDKMHDKYNLNLAPVSEEMMEYGDDSSALGFAATNIPGMGLSGVEEIPVEEPDVVKDKGIPGLSFHDDIKEMHKVNVQNIKMHQMKMPKAKPVPKSFQDAWSSGITVAPGTQVSTGILGQRPPPPLLSKEPNQPGQDMPRPRGLLGNRPPGPGGPTGPRFGAMMGPRAGAPMGPRGPMASKLPSLLDTPISRPPVQSNTPGRPNAGGLLGDTPNKQPGNNSSQDQDYRQYDTQNQFQDEDLRNQEANLDRKTGNMDFRDYSERKAGGDIDDRRHENNCNDYPPQENPYEGVGRGRGRGGRMMNSMGGGMMMRGRNSSPRGGRGGFMPGPSQNDSPGSRKREWEEGPPKPLFGGPQSDFDDREREPMRGGHRGGMIRGRGMPRGGRGGRGGMRGHMPPY